MYNHKLTEGSSTKKEGHLFSQITLPGPEQMALDVILLEKSLKNPKLSIALRFYTWKGPWLSIGKNQTKLPKKWLELARIGKLQIVRRPSGGRAVLHDSGLTYALIWSSPPKKKRESYFQANQWLIKGFSDLGLPLKFGNQSANSIAMDCFQTATKADLVDLDGNKRVGSAQLWRHGHLLQHGEILINPTQKLWLEVFDTPPPKAIPLEISKEKLATSLKRALKSYWSELNWQSQEFSQKELLEITKNNPNYSIDLT